MYLEPLATKGRHGSVSADHSEARQRVSLRDEEVGVIVSRGHLHGSYTQQERDILLTIFQLLDSVSDITSYSFSAHVFKIIINFILRKLIINNRYREM